MGGYCMQSGIAWHVCLGPDLIRQGTLNSLEYFAVCQGDISLATGWIARSSFGDERPLHLMAIAQMMAFFRISWSTGWCPTMLSGSPEKENLGTKCAPVRNFLPWHQFTSVIPDHSFAINSHYVSW